MPKLGEAFVNIRANLKPLKRGLAAAKKAVSLAMKTIGSIIRKAAKMAKRAMIGLIAVYGLAAAAAVEDQQAQVKLAAALRMSGDATKETFNDLMDFAAALQEVTTFGDETTMQLMQLGLSLGVSKDNIKAATKVAIGLAAALGRDAKSMMMYAAMAAQGEFTMLQRYIPALRTTTDESEKLAIITDAAAKGLGIEMANAAKSAAGALLQTKNILGDFLELFGFSAIGGIIKFRDMLEKNKITLNSWAERAGLAVSTVSNLLFTFGKGVFQNFSTIFSRLKDLMIAAFLAIGSSVKALWQKIWVDIKVISNNAILEMGVGALKVWNSMKSRIFGDSPERMAAREKSIADFQKDHPKLTATKTYKDLAEFIGRQWEPVIQSLKNVLPDKMVDALDSVMKEWAEKDLALKEKWEKFRLKTQIDRSISLGLSGGAAGGKGGAGIGFVAPKDLSKRIAGGLTVEALAGKQLKEQEHTTKEIRRMKNDLLKANKENQAIQERLVQAIQSNRPGGLTA